MSMSGEFDAFGDRMKAYEAVETARAFDPALPIYARLDGRSFSRFTGGMDRPLDSRMTEAMGDAACHLVRQTHARIAYHQSDEISLVWLCDTPESQPLFGGKAHKLTSVLASLAAAALQYSINEHWGTVKAQQLAAMLPHFDCRVFQLPTKMEAANAFLWRAMDARKNSVSMAARAHFSAKQLHRQDQAAMRAMLISKGIDFETEYPDRFKWGSWFRRVNFQRSFTEDELAKIPEKHRPDKDALVTRSEVRLIQMPEFHTVANRVEVIFDGADPILNADVVER